MSAPVAATDADGNINADCAVTAAGVRAGPVRCFHADCEDAMRIDMLADAQLQVVELLRLFAGRGYSKAMAVRVATAGRDD